MHETELTPTLERVAASVVETYRKRQQVEDELKAAQAIVESLKAQSTSLEASVLDLRRQLEATLHAKPEEDAALTELAGKRQAAFEQLSAIARDVGAFLGDKDRVMAEIAAHIDASQSSLGSVESDIGSAKSTLASLGNDVGTLREQLAQLRRAADSADRELAEIQSKARNLDGAVDAMAAKVCAIAETIEHAGRSKQKAQTLSDELQALIAALELKRVQEQEAAASMNELIRDREQLTAALVGQLAVITALAPPAGAAAPPGAGNGLQTPPVVEEGNAVQVGQAQPAAGPLEFAGTLSTLELLASTGFIDAVEEAYVAELLHAKDVDKLVRSMWSRAMGGPAPSVYRLIMGQALSESGDAKGAMTFFNQALAGRKVDPLITYLVACAMLRMKRYVEADRIAQMLGRAKNGKLLGRNLDGLHLQSSGRFDEADKKFAEALAMVGYPKLHYQETMYNLARLAQSRGNARGAILWYEKLHAGDASYRDIEVHMASLMSAQIA